MVSQHPTRQPHTLLFKTQPHKHTRHKRRKRQRTTTIQRQPNHNQHTTLHTHDHQKRKKPRKQNKMILNQDIAFRQTQLILKKKYNCWYQIRKYNKGRHTHFKPTNPKKPSFYAIYKREYYETFCHAFPEYCNTHPEMKGSGESINQNSLHLALYLKTDYLLFIHPEGIKKINPMLVYKYCRKHKLVRTQKKLNTYLKPWEQDKKIIQETTYTFPSKLLENL